MPNDANIMIGFPLIITDAAAVLFLKCGSTLRALNSLGKSTSILKRQQLLKVVIESKKHF